MANLEQRQRIFEMINKERDRQDAKYGAERHLHPETWNTILGAEKGEIDRAIVRVPDPVNLMEEIIQTAAVCVAWLELDPESLLAVVPDPSPDLDAVKREIGEIRDGEKEGEVILAERGLTINLR